MMQMVYISLFFVNLIAIWLCISYKVKNVGLITAVSIFSFFAEYVIVSGFLFWFDIFSVMKSLIIMLILNSGILGFLIIKNKKLALDYEKPGINIPLIIILLIAIPFSFFKFGFWGMGSDVGVYQVKAIDLMYTDTFRQKTFDEYQLLDSTDQEEFLTAVKDLKGYYIYDDRKPTLPEDKQITPVDGIYHGIPTYPAILALSGYMFGIENMSALNTLAYIGIILFMNYLCGNFRLNKIRTFLVLSVTALSPVFIWLVKSTLTEIFISFIVVSYLYFITAEDGWFNSGLSVLSIATFSFFHITIFTLIPFFLMCYMIMYIKGENKRHFVCAVISGVAIVTGMSMMIFVSPTYTTNNIVNVINIKNLINDNNCIFMMALFVSAFLVIFALMVYVKSFGKFLQNFIEKKAFTNIIRALGIILIFVCVYNVFQEWRRNNSLWLSVETNSLMAFSYITGIVILPVVIVLLFIKMHELLSSKPALLIVFSFFYCVLFRAAFMSKTVVRYYYHTRYLAPFVPLIAVLAGILITKKITPYILTFVSAATMLPYDSVMFNTNDETTMDWENIIDVTEYIDQDDAVIVDNVYFTTHFLPIKEMTGAHVYPFPKNDIHEKCQQLSQKYNNVFVLSNIDAYALDESLTIVYSDIVHESQDLHQYHNEFIPLPYKFYENSSGIHLMKYSSEETEYEWDSSRIIRDGFIQQTNFAWSTEEESEIYIPVSPSGTVNAEIVFADYIPFNNLGMKHYNVDVYLNNNYYDTIDLVNQKSLSLLLSPENTAGKSGVYIQFHSQLWSPSQIGRSDSRILGFALEKVVLSNFRTVKYSSFELGNIDGTGFGNIENGKFAWSDSAEAEVYCLLEKRFYAANIKCSPVIPRGITEFQTYDVSVYMNGNYIGLMKLGNTEEENEYMFEIPADTLKTGKNTLSFRSKLWSPADFGIDDNRQLGFALESISFEEI